MSTLCPTFLITCPYNCKYTHILIEYTLSGPKSNLYYINQIKSNQIKQFILSHDFYKFWYTLTKIKWLNIYSGKSCVGKRLVRKPYISQDHITRRYKIK